MGIRTFVAFAGCVLASEFTLRPAAPVSEPPARYSIRWVAQSPDRSRIAVEVSGLNPAELAELRKEKARSVEQWQRLLSVYAGQGDLLTDIGLPPMLGAYSITSNVLRFEPQFPLATEVKYHAAFHPDQLPGGGKPAHPPVSSRFQLPAKRSNPETLVTRVYPTAEVLPENLLKFYVYFSAPMSGGHIYEHIHLRNETGNEVELPFLEIDEELWNPRMTRLTLFIDPGRIKREVKPLEEIGPALEEGKSYALVIDKSWKDADGIPMKESFSRTFRVGPPDRAPIDAAQWKLSPPSSGTRSPLVVAFPKPMDHALAQRLIQVARTSGESIDGTPALEDHERRWIFIPADPWTAGGYCLMVRTTIEDLAGNNIGKSFEVDLFEGVQRQITNSTLSLPFEVRGR